MLFAFVSWLFFKNLSQVSVLSYRQQRFVSIPSFRAKLVFALSVFRYSGSKASMLTKHCPSWVRTDAFEATQEINSKESKTHDDALKVSCTRNTAAHGLESTSPRQENLVLLAFFLSLSPCLFQRCRF